MKTIKLNCHFCNKIFEKDIGEYNKVIRSNRNHFFCSYSCSAKYNYPSSRKIKKPKYCLNCEKELNRKIKKYCNLNCKLEHDYKLYIQNWKQGLETGSTKDGASTYIRKYFFEKYNKKCQDCGWGKINPYTNKIPLQLHHMDGNYLNNREENLRLLCLNCHSLTNTFGGRNKGKGRDSRKKWRLKNKNEYKGE